MSSHRVMGEVLWRALNEKRLRLGLSWREVARQMDLSASTFYRLKIPKAGVNADALVSMLAWLGTDQRYYTIPVKVTNQEEKRTG